MTEETLTAPPTDQHKPDLPPPISVAGPIAWLRENLFASPTDIVLTVLCVALIYFTIPPLIDWLFISATWTYPTGVVRPVGRRRGPTRRSRRRR